MYQDCMQSSGVRILSKAKICSGFSFSFKWKTAGTHEILIITFAVVINFNIKQVLEAVKFWLLTYLNYCHVSAIRLCSFVGILHVKQYALSI